MTRSKITQQIINDTPQEVRDRIKEYGDNLVKMNKNEIVARWLELPRCTDPEHKDDPCFLINGVYMKASQLTIDYNRIHEAWVRFRDLRLLDYSEIDKEKHEHWVYHIGSCIVKNTITEAFDELVKGIEWYNSLKK